MFDIVTQLTPVSARSDQKSTRLNSSHIPISYAVFCLKKEFRRVGLAAGPCAGAACGLRAAEVIGAELGWSASQRFDATLDFFLKTWLGREPALGHARSA